MNNVKDTDNNNVYLTLDDKKSDEFILEQNLEALKQIKNGELQRIAKELLSIPAGLVRLKWQNRREIYPLQVKEEIYGATINAIMTQRPELKEKILARLESNYQYLLARETATLRVTRKLAEEGYRTSNVTTVALDEEALAAKTAPTSEKP
ncbi:cytoplasmic protein [Silvania hatchlandensis]|uniref:Cytoplasmic protein n=1 Tax=Silvania hatchlandensis TaxID=2926469 RepID=A0A9J6Q387_9ENTR|nr:cytoplasmic protein [Silvania hatchlandensis]MCU6667071.1 cytoplasmic protein [Silvania hatchlandensis]